MIDNDFPELYQFLEDEPSIIPTEIKNRIDAEVLFRYRDNLKELVDFLCGEHYTTCRGKTDDQVQPLIMVKEPV